MSDLINKYPYTDFHAVNLDYILKLVRENAGLHLEESGNQILLKTADNTIVSAITAPYAASAGSANTASSASYASTAGSASSAGYATNAGTAAAATNATNAVNADHAVTADSATSAASATTAATAAEATHAATASEATHAATADYATTTGSVEHAEKAFESVSQNGDALRFTAYDGSVKDITPAFATRAYRDDYTNRITATYVSNVVDNNGTLVFKAPNGNTIASVTPSIAQAVTDSYGNTIADYVKSVSVESGSNYVTIEHGTGTAETIQIPYSDEAWKDTNGNVIKNTYVKRLEIVTDANDGQKKLVAYNGDNPEAELFRFPVEAYRAQVAAEADHAASADYATSAGTAQTAATSTGSVSSISSPVNEKQKIIITNGDGSTTTFNIYEKANPIIYLVGAENQIMPFDPSFTVGHSEEYTAEDFDKYGWSTADMALQENITFLVVDNDRNTIFTAPAYFVTGAGNCLNVFDPDNTAFKVFSVTAGNADDTLIIERLL